MPDLRPLSAELIKKAASELFEDPVRIDEDLTVLRDWIKKQPHLKCRMDDQFLVTFLRGCKYSIQRCKEKLDIFYTVRSLIPEIFQNRNPLDEMSQKILRMGVQLALPHTEHPDSPRILLIRPGVYAASEVNITDVMRVGMMLNDILMQEDDNLVIGGQIGILDLKNVTMAHFLQFTPTFVKKMTLMSQEASPLRQKGFHYVNTPAGFETVFNMFKSFMSEKNRSRLFVHGDNYDSLYKHIPKRLLPQEYGGEAGPIQDIVTHWEKKVTSYAENFKADEQYGVDEKKRIGKPATSESLFGVEGTFRKLNVD